MKIQFSPTHQQLNAITGIQSKSTTTSKKGKKLFLHFHLSRTLSFDRTIFQFNHQKTEENLMKNCQLKKGLLFYILLNSYCFQNEMIKCWQFEIQFFFVFREIKKKLTLEIVVVLPLVFSILCCCLGAFVVVPFLNCFFFWFILLLT